MINNNIRHASGVSHLKDVHVVKCIQIHLHLCFFSDPVSAVGLNKA